MSLGSMKLAILQNFLCLVNGFRMLAVNLIYLLSYIGTMDPQYSRIHGKNIIYMDFSVECTMTSLFSVAGMNLRDLLLTN